MKVCGIYKITSPSGRLYIGKSVNIVTRFRHYQTLVNCMGQQKLYKSLVKYGPENHKYEIIEECSKELLNEREIYYITKLESVKYGLNIVSGGGGLLGFKHSEEAKIKMSRSKKGRKLSEDHKTNLRRLLVLNMESGIFLSVMEAAHSIGMDEFTLRAKLSGRNKNSTNFKLV